MLKKMKTENNAKSCSLVNKCSYPKKKLQHITKNRNLDPKVKLKEERQDGCCLIPTLGVVNLVSELRVVNLSLLVVKHEESFDAFPQKRCKASAKHITKPFRLIQRHHENSKSLRPWLLDG